MSDFNNLCAFVFWTLMVVAGVSVAVLIKNRDIFRKRKEPRR